jgi:hypothetical protein
MSKHTELPSDTDGPDIDFNPDVDPVPAAHLRALTSGYGVDLVAWFLSNRSAYRSIA